MEWIKVDQSTLKEASELLARLMVKMVKMLEIALINIPFALPHTSGYVGNG